MTPVQQMPVSDIIIFILSCYHEEEDIDVFVHILPFFCSIPVIFYNCFTVFLNNNIMETVHILLYKNMRFSFMKEIMVVY